MGNRCSCCCGCCRSAPDEEDDSLITPYQTPPATPPPTRLFPDQDVSFESPEFRATILRNFICPFRSEATCRHEETPEDCAFAHPETTSPQAELMSLPDYICIYHLLGRCTNVRKVKQLRTLTQGKIVLHGCDSAIHLDPAVLIDLGLFEERYAKVIAEYFIDEPPQQQTIKLPSTAASQPAIEDDLECGICLERPRSRLLKQNRRFALLEHCDHIFCAPCITKYKDQLGGRRPLACPVCRVVSRRYYLSSRFIKSSTSQATIKTEKRRLFDAYKCDCADRADDNRGDSSD